ncbi:MAG: DUF2786 domain-containing protein [Kofleriaceae bacterium]
MHAVLTAQLEAALLRELRSRFEYENYARFGDKLTAPVFALVDSATKLGRWVPEGRRIELSRTFVLERPWLEVMSVLQHELAHQYCDEVLKIRGESAHGDTFRRVCAERGIDGRAGGIPAAADAPDGDRILDRIRKLLALAGSDNRNEAELAMQKAHELMLRHNVDAPRTAVDGRYIVRQIGSPEKRGNRVEGAVLALLAELFFVKVILVPVWLPLLGKRGTAYEISGTRANVDMAEHVYSFLLATADRLWRENRGDTRVKSGRDRLSYQMGVIGGFRDKLLADRVALQQTGLVWVGDADLDRHYRARHPRVTTRKRSMRLDDAHEAGREAGRTVVLHKPVTDGPTATGPRLLR